MTGVRTTKEVLGHSTFPMVCVITGEPTTSKATYGQLPTAAKNQRGKELLQMAFFGFAIGMVLKHRREHRAEYFVNLPTCRQAWERLTLVRRVRAVVAAFAYVAAIGGLVGLLQGSAAASLMFAVAAVCGAGFVALHRAVNAMFPTVDDEGNATWVTIRPVHPGFAKALADAGLGRPTAH